MPTSSSLTEQLAVIGVHLPTWPKEPEGSEAGCEWIQLAQVYAEGVRLWRAQLRNAPESTKGVIDQLLRHLDSTQQLLPWDHWLASAVHPDVVDGFALDRWEGCIEQIQTSPLSAAQLLGGSLALAEAHQLAGATNGIKRLLRDHLLTGEMMLEICSQFLAAANTSWRMEEANHCSEAFRKALDIHHEWCILMKTVANWPMESQAETETGYKNDVIQSLERALLLYGDEDKWSLQPRAKVKKFLDDGQVETAIHLLTNFQPATLEPCKREGYARLLACQLLASMGKWQQANALHQTAVSSLNAYEHYSSSLRAHVKILHIETELLSHELSIALKNGSLSTESSADTPLEQQGKDQIMTCWQSLSRSQLGQDLWVLEKLCFMKGGYFVEFGATDGVLLSNTWLLEKYFGWQGICAEPNPSLFTKLKRNRSCQLSEACVHSVSGEKMQFVVADVYGGLVDFTQDDQHGDKRAVYAETAGLIEVETVSLLDLLDHHNAPRIIDYLSIDTEGSELAILEGIDWERYQFRCISVEHNFSPNRKKIQHLLEANGYSRTELQWDDMYFKHL